MVLGCEVERERGREREMEVLYLMVTVLERVEGGRERGREERRLNLCSAR